MPHMQSFPAWDPTGPHRRSPQESKPTHTSSHRDHVHQVSGGDLLSRIALWRRPVRKSRAMRLPGIEHWRPHRTFRCCKLNETCTPYYPLGTINSSCVAAPCLATKDRAWHTACMATVISQMKTILTFIGVEYHEKSLARRRIDGNDRHVLHRICNCSAIRLSRHARSVRGQRTSMLLRPYPRRHRITSAQ